jgi:hypothetical protein
VFGIEPQAQGPRAQRRRSPPSCQPTSLAPAGPTSLRSRSRSRLTAELVAAPRRAFFRAGSLSVFDLVLADLPAALDPVCGRRSQRSWTQGAWKLVARPRRCAQSRSAPHRSTWNRLLAHRDLTEGLARRAASCPRSFLRARPAHGSRTQATANVARSAQRRSFGARARAASRSTWNLEPPYHQPQTGAARRTPGGTRRARDAGWLPTQDA